MLNTLNDVGEDFSTLLTNPQLKATHAYFHNYLPLPNQQTLFTLIILDIICFLMKVSLEKGFLVRVFYQFCTFKAIYLFIHR